MGASILCVDNDRNLCEILAKALRGEGYRVSTAFDGEHAVGLLRRAPPDFLLLDLMLPKLDGFEVLQQLRAMPEPVGAIPVVLISGASPTPEYRRRAEELRAAGLLRKPVSLETLLSVVARELGRPSQTPARAPAQTAAAPGSDLSGSFDQLPFPALLHQLHGLRATGVLHLSHDRKRKWLRLHDGYPVGVRSNLVNECLGNFLVRAGRITASELAESRRRMKGGKLQGEMLVAMDLLSEDEVAIALRSQADEKLFEIFSWPAGAFRFEVGGNLQRANEIAVERSPANLILEGVRTRLPIERIDANFAANSHCLLALSENPFYRFQEIDIDGSQQKLVRGLEKPRRVVEFISADEPIRRTLFGLIAAGVLELRGTVASAKPAAVRAAKIEARPAARATQPKAKVTTLREIVRPSPEDTKPAELTLLAQRFRSETPFQILGVPENADEQQIQAAYGKLCEQTHPDRVSQSSEAVKALASEVFAMVANAYETLIDPRRRQAYLLGQRKADRDAAERAVGRRALDAEIQFQEGDAAMRARDYTTALRCFGRALELYPEEGEYHAHYGWVLHLCHPSDTAMAAEAMEHVQRALKLAPDREKPYLFMGRLCKAIGRPDAAEKMFVRALKIQPDCLDALRELRLINMRREKGKSLIGRLLRR